MMRFAIDTSELRFLVAAPASPLRLAEDEADDARGLRAGDDGDLLWRVPLVTLGERTGAAVPVMVPGDPHLAEGETVAVAELVVLTWRHEGRSGVSLRAGAITATSERAVSEGP
jgi:hypothetical protein